MINAAAIGSAKRIVAVKDMVATRQPRHAGGPCRRDEALVVSCAQAHAAMRNDNDPSPP